ncbi:LysM peptidoglycan-binding domain-containing protein [Patescibacteria group bacterium]|nr:LysM peptidoglycan-binding domain-containing protein [Patescibacteria group bacterium]
MKKTKTLFMLSCLWLSLATVLSAALPTYAVETKGISILPSRTADYPELRSWFIYEAEPGTVIKDKVDLLNNGNKSVTLIVASLDGAITSNGGYTLVRGLNDNKDIGNWVELEATEVTLPPRSSRTLNFTVTVPTEVDVGSHPGGLVTWEKPAEATASKNKSGSTLSVVTRVAARMYLTVPGEIQRRLEVKQIRHSLSGGVLYFFLRLRNDGNVQFETIADIALRGIFGRVGVQNGSQIGLLLRGTEISAKLPWQSRPPTFGRYVADFRLHYGEKDFKGEYVKDEYIDVRYVFWIIPWLKLLWFIGFVILLLLIRNLWLWLLIQNRLNTRTKKHKVKKGETLLTISQLYGVHPKKLAQFNLLKWPYQLNVGDILLIPQGQMNKRERAAMGKEWNEYYRTEQRKIWSSDIKFIGRWLGRLRFRRRGEVVPPRHPEPTGQRPSSDSGSRPGFRGPGRAGKPGMTKGVGQPMVVATEILIAEKGDTIYDISEFSGVSIEEIAQLNRLRPPYRIRAGQEIVVPLKRKSANLVKRKRRTKKPSVSKKSHNRSTKRKR